MVGLYRDRLEHRAMEVAVRYTGVAASVGETIDSLLNGKPTRIPLGSFRGIQNLFDNAQNYIIERHYRKFPNFECESEYQLIRKVLGEDNIDPDIKEDLNLLRKIQEISSITKKITEREIIPLQERLQYQELLEFYRTLMNKGLDAMETLRFLQDDND